MTAPARSAGPSAGAGVARVLRAIWDRLRHAVRLGRELVAFTVLNGTWWLLPLVVLVALLALGVAATQHALPYAVYTLF